VLPELLFLDAISVRPNPWLFYDFVDGAFGLAPFAPSSGRMDSPFKALVESKIVDHSMFSFIPPRGTWRSEEPRAPGRLTIGRSLCTDTQTNGKTISFPLSKRSFTEEKWLVIVEAMSWNNEEMRPPRRSVEISLTTFGIMLPWPYSNLVNRQINATREGIVDCHARAQMPNLDLRFGDAVLTLTPFDYTFEALFKNNSITKTMCFSKFYDDNIHDSSEAPMEETIVIGVDALENFIIDWDLDEEQIRSK